MPSSIPNQLSILSDGQYVFSFFYPTCKPPRLLVTPPLPSPETQALAYNRKAFGFYKDDQTSKGCLFSCFVKMNKLLELISLFKKEMEFVIIGRREEEPDPEHPTWV